MSESWHQNVKNKNREELVAAGKELFLQQSFLQVNIKDVCDLAKVSRVTFYKHFQTMDELIFEVQKELLEWMIGYVEERASGGANGREKLRSMLEAWTEFASSHPGAIRFILMFDFHYEAYDANPELKAGYESFISEKKEQHFLMEALAAGQREGLLKPELDIRETGQFMFTAMMGLLQKLILSPREQWGRMPDMFVEMLIRHVSL